MFRLRKAALSRLCVRKYKRRTHRKHIAIELTVGISPLHNLYVSVTSGTRTQDETCRPSGPICVSKRLLWCSYFRNYVSLKVSIRKDFVPTLFYSTCHKMFNWFSLSTNLFILEYRYMLEENPALQTRKYINTAQEIGLLFYIKNYGRQIWRHIKI